jgi:dimeric dUTPase (all-alpha-NTP-PPase superfamily)
MDFLKDISNAREICLRANSVLIGMNWDSTKHDWALCASVELGELISHLGFKYWRKVDPDWMQAFIEVIDAFHFAMSRACEVQFSITLMNEALISSEDDRINILRAFDLMSEEEKKISAVTKAKLVMADLLEVDVEAKGQEFVRQEMVRIIVQLFDLAASMGFESRDIFDTYTAKITLTHFRQSNGDRDGTYPRMWGFEGHRQEDNQVLERILRAKPELILDFNALTEALSKEYYLLNKKRPRGFVDSADEASSYDAA